MKAANCDARGCPPAVIVAAEGGASRAAFAAATGVGELIDRANEQSDGKDLAKATAPARRIFAISAGCEAGVHQRNRSSPYRGRSIAAAATLI